MQKSATGTYVTNKLNWPKSEADVIDGCGRNTVAHRAYVFWKTIFRDGAVGIIAYPETSGGTPVSASTTIPFTGTATKQGVMVLGIAEIDVSIFIDTGDDAATVAANARTAAAGAGAPVTISGTSTNLIISFIHPGTCGGTASYKPIKLTLKQPGNGIVATLPGDLGATTPGAEGTTTEAANFQAALDANSSVRMYNIVSHLGGNAAALTSGCAYLLNQAMPRSGRRETLIVGYNGTVSAGTTLAVARNFVRQSFVNGAGFRNSPEQVAVQMAALFSKYEKTDPTYNFNRYSGADFILTPVEDSTQWLDDDARNEAILGGQIVFGVNEVSRGFVNKATVTRVRDDSGQYADFRAYERHRVSGTDDTADLIVSAVGTFLQGKKLVDDPLMPDKKTINWNKIALFERGVTCAAMVRPTVLSILEERARVGQAQRFDEMSESLRVKRSTENRGRVTIEFKYYTCDHADQGAIYMAESTPG
jgi:phage tail sheath gpL-like